MKTKPIDPDAAWKLYAAALMGLPELAGEMRRQNLSWGDRDLAEDAEGLRPILLREVSAALAAEEGA